MRSSRFIAVILLGKLIRIATRLRGGGSALPGWVVLRLMPDFIAVATAQLEHGVVVVLGSNGKSTTTNMVTGIVSAHGARVFTNPSGANMPQGVASSLLGSLTVTGTLPYDIGVVEVDEAYGELICRALRPRAGVILNVQIDQIYRLFEPDRVAGMFRRIAELITQTVVLNRDDPFLSELGDRLQRGDRDVAWFGVHSEVLSHAPHGQVLARNYGAEATARVGAPQTAAVEVTQSAGADAVLRAGGELRSVRLSARGLHNAVDAAAAVLLAQVTFAEQFSLDTAIHALESTKTVYGRGERITAGDREIEILLMKSLASLQMNLDSFDTVPDSVLMAFDEHSRDPSWLYAADVSVLPRVECVSGPKAVFLALRLEYADIPYARVETDVEKAVQSLLDGPRPPSGVHTLILDYDQMIIVRRYLGYRDLEAGAA
jgi:lipid II isoglutaminyl synthase (glutamine-hydrolysing)